jgi:acetylornithine/N-succinyldiaminopimelate aminotransferase
VPHCRLYYVIIQLKHIVIFVNEDSSVSLETLPLVVIADSSPVTGFDAAAFDQCVMPTYGRFPLAIARGEGCRLWDTDGNSYLDFVAGIATCTLGHAHPALVEAVTQQIQTLHHVSNLYYIPQQGDLAQWLTQHSCADFAFFCNSGAEANEGAIKLARKYAHTVQGIQNPVIITANASFHGRTLATVTATGQPKYQQNFSPLVPGFYYVPYNDIAALETVIAELDATERQVSAILLEPLQGEGGVRPGDIDYFKRVRQLCDEKGILLILDEVQVGIGRTGKLWGYENLGIEPDIFTSAKGLAGGIPIGAMLCKTFCNVFTPGDHASTFGGNPFVCAVALAVGNTLMQDNLLTNALERGEQLRMGLRAIATQYPSLISEVRGWGLINGMELKSDAGLSAADIVKVAMSEGLLLVPAGPTVVRFVPPLIVTEAEVNEALSIVTRVLGKTIL